MLAYAGAKVMSDIGPVKLVFLVVIGLVAWIVLTVYEAMKK